MSQKDNLIQTLIKLDNDARFNGIRSLARKGVIRFEVNRHYEIYLKYDVYIQTGFKKKQAFDNTLNDFDLDRSTLYRIINAMEK